MKKPQLKLVKTDDGLERTVEILEPTPAKHDRRDQAGWIQTFTGKQFWPVDPDPASIDIRDIAMSLSRQCRFTGHTKKFYSVAEHCVRVSYACDQKDALWGLLHDASEAYIVDIAQPLKIQPEFSGYRVIEKRVMDAVCERFGLHPAQPVSVTRADRVVLATEKRDVMGIEPAPWMPLPEPLPARIQVMDPEYARQAFLWRFHTLRGD